MNLNYSGQETIAAPHDAVWKFINDPASIASCMPDVLSSTVIDPHTFDAVVGVAVGPVRGKFTFHVTLEPQPDEKRLNMNSPKVSPHDSHKTGTGYPPESLCTPPMCCLVTVIPC